MIGRGQMRAALLLLGIATLLMIVGLAVELGMTRPRLEEIRRLEARQRTLAQQAAGEAARRQEIRDMAATLHVEDLSELRGLADLDPVVFVGRTIQQAQLVRRELSAHEIQEDASLKRSRFYVRVEGSYARMLNFVRILEQSARPVTIEALDIKVPLGGSSLEARFEITVHDPIQAQEVRP